MVLFGAIAALTAAAAPAQPVVVQDEQEQCCRITINVKNEELPCLLEFLKTLEPGIASDVKSLQKLLDEKAEACRKPAK